MKNGWRKTSPEDRRSSYAEKFVIGIQASHDVDLYALVASESDYLPVREINEHKQGATIKLMSTFHSLAFEADYDEVFGSDSGKHPIAEVDCHRDFEAHYDNTILANLKEYEVFSINMGHGIFDGYTARDELERLCSDRPDLFTIKGEMFNILGEFAHIDGNKQFNIDYFTIIQEKELSKTQAKVFRKTVDIYNKFINMALQIGYIVVPELVNASRMVPTEAELTINLPGDFEYEEYDKETLLDKFYHGSKEDKYYKEIAISFAKSLSPRGAKEEDSLPHKKINSYLSDYLFVDRGYQLDFDYLMVMTSKQFYGITEEFDSYYPNAYELIIQIYLKDENGIKLKFEDVGSGLGYALPVLSVLGSEGWGNVFIQQPELHLHPALQAAMGDVLIDASRHQSILVETHSEHILLRSLKRIRQSANGKLSDERLVINPDEINVMYFDRSVDGSTNVSRLRISADGEFMDKWPHGFFEERDQELFDE